MKRTIAWIAVFALMLFATACSGGVSTQTAAQEATASAVETEEVQSDLLELTLDELKQYDGKNGNPAYVAVDGVIYDFSELSAWKDGEHNGYSAGNDLTDIIKNKSPHGVSKLNGVTIVGTLVDG